MLWVAIRAKHPFPCFRISIRMPLFHLWARLVAVERIVSAFMELRLLQKTLMTTFWGETKFALTPTIGECQIKSLSTQQYRWFPSASYSPMLNIDIQIQTHSLHSDRAQSNEFGLQLCFRICRSQMQKMMNGINLHFADILKVEDEDARKITLLFWDCWWFAQIFRFVCF